MNSLHAMTVLDYLGKLRSKKGSGASVWLTLPPETHTLLNKIYHTQA